MRPLTIKPIRLKPPHLRMPRLRRQRLSPEERARRREERRTRRREALAKKKEQLRHGIPSGFTLANAFFGFLALSAVMRRDIIMASVLLFFAALMDTLDGKVARSLSLTSPFGLELDSLADTISFVVVPAMMISIFFFGDGLGIVIGAVAVMCGISRLAKFNTRPFTGYYSGVSTPLFTLMVMALSLAKGLSPGSAWSVLPDAAYAAVFLALSLTMVSPLPYPAFRERHLGKYKTWAFLAVIIFVLAIFLIRPSQVQLAFIAYAIIAMVLAPLHAEPIRKKLRLTLFICVLLLSGAVLSRITADTAVLLLFPVFYVILGMPTLAPCFSPAAGMEGRGEKREEAEKEEREESEER